MRLQNGKIDWSTQGSSEPPLRTYECPFAGKLLEESIHQPMKSSLRVLSVFDLDTKLQIGITYNARDPWEFIEKLSSRLPYSIDLSAY